jgi:hypothetical protein
MVLLGRFFPHSWGSVSFFHRSVSFRVSRLRTESSASKQDESVETILRERKTGQDDCCFPGQVPMRGASHDEPLSDHCSGSLVWTRPTAACFGKWGPSVGRVLVLDRTGRSAAPGSLGADVCPRSEGAPSRHRRLSESTGRERHGRRKQCHCSGLIVVGVAARQLVAAVIFTPALRVWKGGRC